MKKSVTNNIIYNMLFQFFTTFLPVITTPYLARTLGVSQSGVFSFVESIVILFTTFGSIGTSLYGCRKVAYVRDNENELQKVTMEIILLKLILLIPVILLYLIMFCISGEYKLYFIINLFTIIGSTIDLSWYFNGIEDFKSVTIKNFIIKIIFVICLFLFIKNPQDLTKYFILVCFTNFLGNFVMWYCLPKQMLKLKKYKNLKPMSHLKSSFILFIPQSANYIYSTSDKAMLGYLTPNISNVGIYDYAYRIVKMIVGILQSIGYVILARVANLSSKDNEEEISRYIYKSIKFTLFLGLPMMFGLIGIANNFVPLYLGEEFAEVTKVIYVLCPLILLTSYNSILGVQLLLAIKKDKQYTMATVIGAITNIVLNIILIPIYGIYGACITSLISEILVFIIESHYSKQYVKIKKVIRENANAFIVSIIMFLICGLICLLKINAIIILLLQLVISVLIYFGLMLLIKDEMCKEIINKALIVLKRKAKKE